MKIFLTCYWCVLICITVACVSDLLTLRLHNFSNDVPDKPCNEGNDNLHNHYDEPQNVHYQEKHHLKISKIVDRVRVTCHVKYYILH